MKVISNALQAHLEQDVTTLATCWRVTRRDGTVMGFTDHDSDLVVESVTYEAATGFTPTAISSSAALNVDNLDIEGLLDAGAITTEDLLAGLYDYAEITVFQVNHAFVGDGVLLLRQGWLGEVTCEDGQFIAEVRGLTQPLSQRVGEVYSPSCRAVFGDARCGINVALLTQSGTITAVTSRTVLLDTARTEDAGTFSSGVLTFTSGANAGLSVEVKEYTPGTITLVLPTSYAVEVGDAYTITEGCDKRFSTCANRFANAVNFRGEPHVPGFDRLLETAATRSEW